MPTFLRNGQPFTFGPFSVGEDEAAVNYPANILLLWSDAELAAIGVERVPDPEPTAEELFALAKLAKYAELASVYDARRQMFPITLEGVEEHLQLRDNTNDARNWMILQRRALEQVALGNGDAISPLPVRAASNAQYSLTYQAIADALEAMENWGMYLMGASWALKNAIDAAADQAALDAINVSAGLPG